MTPYEDKTMKDSLREERHKLKDMSFKDKIWYIWEYYKFPIIGVLLAIAFIASIGTALYNNRFETGLSCVILNSTTGTLSGENDPADHYFEQGFRPYAGIPEDVKIVVDHSMSITFDDSAMNEFAYAEMAKLTAMISSKELDVLIGKKDTMDHYAGLGGFADLKELLPPEVYDKIKDNIYTVTDEETGEDVACGLSIKNTDFQKKTGLSIDEPVLAVLSNSTHTDTCVALICYVFGL